MYQCVWKVCAFFTQRVISGYMFLCSSIYGSYHSYNQFARHLRQGPTPPFQICFKVVRNTRKTNYSKYFSQIKDNFNPIFWEQNINCAHELLRSEKLGILINSKPTVKFGLFWLIYLYLSRICNSCTYIPEFVQNNNKCSNFIYNKFQGHF